MRVSYEWLKSMVDVPEDPQDLVREFVRTGTEVEAVERVGADITNVVTSQVVEKVPHPDSDHMFVCKMDVGMRNVDENGNPVPVQVVCGAQNFEKGDKTVTALVGATLPGDVKIKKGKLRGVESYGMNCSSRELGMDSDHSGIMILPADTPVGLDFIEWKGMSDTVIDCEITPNRPDCLSMCGMAVEVSAMLDEDTHMDLPSIQNESADFGRTADLVDVKIDDPELCGRYTARVVRNVKIGPSPEWLARRVIAAGARPINNVVDVTNYVMFLTGQPLHAFDLGKLAERDGKRHIVVRAAKDGERLTTLDEQERELTSDMVVITDDGNAPVALAGVMGGLNSDIDEDTVDVLLESAVFDSGHVSRASRNLDLMSEASIRFERQVDGEKCALVSDIAAALFEQCCGAQVCEGMVDEYPAPVAAPQIELRPDRVRTLCGAPIETGFMARRLERLGCTVMRGADEHAAMQVVAPTNRPDLTREIDLVEEVLRLWGEGDVEPTLPAARNHAGGLTVEQQRLRKIGRVLRSSGLSETSTYNFADPRDLEMLGMSEEGRGVPVKIMRPLVADQSEMRRDMIPGLLRSVAYNLDHGVSNVHLYEIGRVFFGSEHKSQPEEPSFVAGVMCGAWNDDQWNRKYPNLDFFDAKGIVENLLEALRITKVRFKVADPGKYGWLQPGRAAEVIAQGELLGWVGNIHPMSLKNFDIDVPVIAFELSVKALLRLAKRELPYEDVPTLPGVSIDLALVVGEDMSFEQVTQRIKSAGGKLLSDVQLFDVYRDPVRVGKGKKSMAFSLTYRAADHTLTSEEVDKAHNKLVTKVMKSTGGEVRS
ncbi:MULTISPECIES: phenylalanine--tRNA ligase subunit beta [Atopobiaceae]|uniref:Phenylalanine--tRNA ligase beta subunit n=1 Tax=Parafannyhessea umbonata TaxID=604330 RepID=A0A1H6HQV8_9ACTN|nr:MULTISPECIES: phenylalanine--tRNA ligase subunit beta [Atopobiaceae]SEH37891.1 phenylalanyl-tRNA synthetase beta subunit [Parafannyhessea umbonata]SJZ40479.1 phenylalanyl-tRNA synthetase beta subunit [Olsenella sp. KH1P3]